MIHYGGVRFPKDCRLVVKQLDECGDKGAIKEPYQRLTADKAEKQHDVENEADFHHISLSVFYNSMIISW